MRHVPGACPALDRVTPSGERVPVPAGIALTERSFARRMWALTICNGEVYRAEPRRRRAAVRRSNSRASRFMVQLRVMARAARRRRQIAGPSGRPLGHCSAMPCRQAIASNRRETADGAAAFGLDSALGAPNEVADSSPGGRQQRGNPTSGLLASWDNPAKGIGSTQAETDRRSIGAACGLVPHLMGAQRGCGITPPGRRQPP